MSYYLFEIFVVFPCFLLYFGAHGSFTGRRSQIPETPKNNGISDNIGYQQHSRPDDPSAVIRERLVDYIAIDVKAPFGKDAAIAGVQVDTNAIREQH